MNSNDAIEIINGYAEKNGITFLDAMCDLKRLNNIGTLDDDELRTAFLVAFDGFRKLFAPKGDYQSCP